jgi:valyl-tRNA synthetase
MVTLGALIVFFSADFILSEIKRVDSRLSNEGFVSKAPQKLIDEEKAKKVKFEEMLKQVEEKLNEL